MILVIAHKGQDERRYPVTWRQVANLCLGLVGGGWTDGETVDAMTIQAQLLEGETVSGRDGTTWRLEQ